MQKILSVSVLAVTLGLSGCDWFQGPAGPSGPPAPLGQRAIKAIQASRVHQVRQVRQYIAGHDRGLRCKPRSLSFDTNSTRCGANPQGEFSSAMLTAWCLLRSIIWLLGC